MNYGFYGDVILDKELLIWKSLKRLFFPSPFPKRFKSNGIDAKCQKAHVSGQYNLIYLFYHSLFLNEISNWGICNTGLSYLN